MNNWKYLVLAMSLAVLGGCDYTKRVAFGTTTSYGLDVDTEPTPSLSIGIDRTELIVGPRYSNGAIPPVVAHIEATGGLFNAGVAQIYATGDASKIVTKKSSHGAKDKDLTGTREVMIFGTNTNLGIKATFAGNIPKSFNFGYKRQELSIIPIGIAGAEAMDASGNPKLDKNGNPIKIDTYGSVLARIKTGAGISGTETAGRDGDFKYESYFATGVAAENVAELPAIQSAFEQAAVNSYAAYGADDNTKLLRDFWKPGGTKNLANETKLKGWMKNNSLPTGPGDITMFLRAEKYGDARSRAVKALKL